MKNRIDGGKNEGRLSLKRYLVLGFAAGGLMTACSTPRQLTTVEPVGPSRTSAAAAEGALQVYTATETHPDGDNTYYYPHTSYLVYDSAGHKVKFVQNHIGTMDETPSVVFIAPGNYTVQAEAEGLGRVRIPVVVQPRRTTVVHLEKDWKPRDVNSSELVRLPDGQPIGWRSSAQVTPPNQDKTRQPES